jgi:hypothetical protein
MITTNYSCRICPWLAIQGAGLAITQRHHLWVASGRSNPQIAD